VNLDESAYINVNQIGCTSIQINYGSHCRMHMVSSFYF